MKINSFFSLTSRSPGRVLLILILALGGGLRLAHLRAHLASPLGHMEQEIHYTDVWAFTNWAGKIAAGDLLGRDTYHPYMDWMKSIAPLATFERWWGSRAIYHQAPLYAYLLGASYALTGGPALLLVLQALLGTLAVGLVYLVGRRLVDRRAGLAAAALAAFFPPAIVLDAILLRASLVASLTLLATYVLLRLQDRPAWRPGLAAGLVLGLNLLLKPTGLLLALAGPAVLLLSPARKQWPAWLLPLAGGFLLCLAPLAARNLAVGAPVLALSTRGPETVLQANNVYADPGSFTTPPSREYARLMEKAHPSVPAALATAITTWPDTGPLGRFGWWLWHLGRKLVAAYRDFEYPNNTNFYFYRRATPLLRYLPSFGWFAGAALVGIWLLARRGRDRQAALVPLVAALVLLGSILISFAFGRYRMPLALLLTIPAGATLSILWQWLRAKRYLAGALLAAGAVLLSLPSFLWAPPRFFNIRQLPGGRLHLNPADSMLLEVNTALRPLEYTRAATVLHRRGEAAAARALLGEYLALVRERGAQTPGGITAAGRLVQQETLTQALREVGGVMVELGQEGEAKALRREAAVSLREEALAFVELGLPRLAAQRRREAAILENK